MSNYKVRNYNMSYEVLLDAVNEFEGYITGGGINNQLFTYGLDEEILGQKMAKFTDVKIQEDRAFMKEISSRILDRTTGTYYMRKIMAGEAIKTEAWGKKAHQGLIEFCYLDEGLKAPFLSYNHDIFNKGFYKESGLDSSKENPSHKAPASIRDVVAGLDPTSLKREEVADEEAASEQKASDKKKTKFVVRFKDGKAPVKVSNAVAVNKSEAMAQPHRFTAPSLGAIICKHSKINFSGKKAQHLSVFFNAVSTLEMSRATPFLNLTVMSERQKGSGSHPKMSPIAWWRFVKDDKKGNLILDDGIGMSLTKPAQAEGAESITDLADANISTDYSYMDIFTSPQTMANANINQAGAIAMRIDKVAKLQKKDSSYNTSPVLEPIMPMMTINSVTIGISGNGHGLMASKVAKLSLTLHDRSRLKDLAPLISSDKFSSTKIQLEYGWSHPEEGPASTNTIGKYLGALRDVGLYTVRGVDYNFSGGNTVTIDVKLTCSGFNETKSIPAAAGDTVPLFMLRDYIDAVVRKIVNYKKGVTDEEKFPEVRNILKSRQRDAKSSTSLIPHTTFSGFYNELKNAGPEGSKKVADYVASMLGYQLEEDLFDDTGELMDVEGVWDKATAQTLKQRNAGTAAEHLMSKVYACRAGIGPDPFVGCFITECKSTEEKTMANPPTPIEATDVFPAHSPYVLHANSEDSKLLAEHHVTLGKLCMMFIGYPLSTCGLYDEVQVVFYPMNHQSAGARKHTTASFPVPYSKLEKAFKDHVEKSSRLSVHGAFRIFEKIVRDRSNDVYGFSNVFQPLEDYKEMGSDDRLAASKAYCEGIENLDTSKMKDEDILKEYRQYLIKSQKNAVKNALQKTWKTDGVTFQSQDKFVRPNISLFFEVIPAVDVKAGDNQAAIFEETKAKFKRLGDAFAGEDKNKTNSDGLRSGESILRVHIYDEESVSAPATLSMSNILYEGKTEALLGEGFKNNETLEKLVKGEDKGTAKDSEKEDFKITKAVKQMSFGQIKEFVKREFPSITYGANTATINTVSVSGNTSGQLANVVMVEQYGKMYNAQTAQNKEDDFEEVILFPGSVSVQMMGMPMLSRGENIFIDFGTDTSLDNVYVVKSVNHSIESGKFTTSLELVNSNQGAVKSFRKQMINKVNEMVE